MRLIYNLPVFFLSLFLVSCGGGGSSSPSDNDKNTPSVQVASITANNSSDVSDIVLMNTFNGFMVGMSEIFTGVVVDNNEQTKLNTYLTVDEIKVLIEKALNADNQFTGVVTSNEESCGISGSTQMNISIANQFSLSNNDYIEIVSVGCVEADGVSTSGKMKLTFKDVNNFNFISDVFNITIEVALTDFVVSSSGVDVNMVGSYNMDINSGASGYSTIIKSDSFETSITPGFQQKVSNLTLNESYSNGSNMYILNVASTVFDSGLNGSLNVVTETDFLFFNSLENEPTQGTLKVTGANSSSMLIDVISPSIVSVKVDADGDNVYESNTFHSWSELTDNIVN